VQLQEEVEVEVALTLEHLLVEVVDQEVVELVEELLELLVYLEQLIQVVVVEEVKLLLEELVVQGLLYFVCLQLIIQE
jgi:hypothetical protein